LLRFFDAERGMERHRLLSNVVLVSACLTCGPRAIAVDDVVGEKKGPASAWVDSNVVQPGVGDGITLRQALALTLERNPDLAAFPWQLRASDANVQQVGRRPNPELGLQLEDVLGTRDFSGFERTQATLELSQLLELGGKRSQRVEVASRARDLVVSEYDVAGVDILGEVARRFIQVVADQHEVDLARTTTQLSDTTLSVVRQRVRAAKVSSVEETKARVALARSRIVLARAEHRLAASRAQLAAMWGDPRPAFARAEADLFSRRTVPAYDELAGRVAASLEIARWASEARLREAEIRLANSKRTPDVTLSVGARRLESDDAETFLMGAILPLPLFDRKQGAIAEARALLEKSAAQRQAAETRLLAMLFGLHEQLLQAASEMEAIEADILPQAEEALTISQQGFVQGRFSFLELLDAQRTLTEVRREQIDAAASYHRVVVEIEALTGRPIR